MNPKSILEELSSKVEEVFQSSPAKNIEKNIKAIVGSAFSKLDLVTREEFEIQQNIIQKIALTLNKLENKLQKLENEEK